MLNPEEATPSPPKKDDKPAESNQPPESRKSFSAEDNAMKPPGEDQPQWLASELNSLNQLKIKFSKKYKRTLKRIESCSREDQA